MPDIRLIATDLDGTLIGSVDEFPLYAEFRDRVNRLRRENDASWAVCTGRAFRSFREFFSPMKAMGLEPEVVIIRHAFIYTRTRLGYTPHLMWNLRILLLLCVDRHNARNAIREWDQLVRRSAHGVRTVRRRKDRLWLRFGTDEAANYAAAELRKRVAPFRHFRVFQYRREVDVRSVPFTKGMALKELARRLGIPREQVLAIGNGHNDISALDGTAAAYTGCPANSEPEVMEVVHRSGGHIARERSLRGVIEIVDAVTGGQICSELPPSWEDPSKGENPSSRRAHRSARSKRVQSMVLAAVSAYTTLVVFASFGRAPGARIIMAPWRKLFAWLEAALSGMLEHWIY